MTEQFNWLQTGEGTVQAEEDVFVSWNRNNCLVKWGMEEEVVV